MHYLKHDPGHREVLNWSIQHRQSLVPLSEDLAKHVLTGMPIAVSSLAVLSAGELATIFTGESRIVAVAEGINTLRSTAMGDVHWSTLKLLASVFKAWATAVPPASDGKGEDLASMKAKLDGARERMADMAMELAMLRNGQAAAAATPEPEIPPAVMAEDGSFAPPAETTTQPGESVTNVPAPIVPPIPKPAAKAKRGQLSTK